MQRHYLGARDLVLIAVGGINQAPFDLAEGIGELHRFLDLS